jgi:hypothetical protein
METMEAISEIVEPTHVFDKKNKTYFRTAEAVRVVDAYYAAKYAMKQVDKTFAGALLAEIFFERQELESFFLNLEPYEEYDDNNYYRAIRLTVRDLTLNSGDPDEAFSESIQEELEECAYEIYEAFGEPDSYVEYSFVLERSSIADLLQSPDGLVKGSEAFMRLFPT